MKKKEEKKAIKDTDDPYDDEKVEEMMDEDEIDPAEAGFMEGYNEKQQAQKRKPNDIAQEDKRKD